MRFNKSKAKVGVLPVIVDWRLMALKMSRHYGTNGNTAMAIGLSKSTYARIRSGRFELFTYLNGVKMLVVADVIGEHAMHECIGSFKAPKVSASVDWRLMAQLIKCVVSKREMNAAQSQACNQALTYTVNSNPTWATGATLINLAHDRLSVSDFNEVMNGREK